MKGDWGTAATVATVAAVTSFARRAAKPHAWNSAIAALTVAFGVGQCIGPVLSGALSDIVAAFQPEPEAS